MKVNDIFCEAVILCGSDDPEEYRVYALAAVNNTIAKIFNNNNANREYKGLEKWDKPPRVKDLGEEMPTEDEFTAAVINGVASELLIYDGDMDEGKHVIFQNNCVALANENTKVLEYSVEDVYEIY